MTLHLSLRVIAVAAIAARIGLTGSSPPTHGRPGEQPEAPVTEGVRSAGEFGFSASRTAAENKAALQRAIDWASGCGGVVRIDPSPRPYPVASGLVLKHNASLQGVHGPVGRGTRSPEGAWPVGSVVEIRDTSAPFLTVETATQIRGIQFWYPEQSLTDPSRVIQYPPTIRVSQTSPVWGVTLSALTFYGEYAAMDFAAGPDHACEQILIEHCHGYPLSGSFVRIERCYDVPRILHCHVNPANMRAFAGDFRRAVIDSVVARGTYAFSIDRTDNAVLMDLFTFGTYGGAYLGAASYGQLTSFNFDCVTIGIFKDGDSPFNRNWMVSQGSVIANIGERVADIHPVVVQGQGHLSISNVESFSGPNAAVTARGRSWDFLVVRGSDPCTVSMSGCRMRDYESATPVTRENGRASILATGCFDKHGAVFELAPPRGDQ